MKTTIIFFLAFIMRCQILTAQTYTPYYSCSHSSDINAVIKIPGKKIVATCSDDAKIKLWDENLTNDLATFQEHGNAIVYMVASKDGKHILSGDKSGNAFFWNIETMEIEKGIYAGKQITTMDISNDNSKCVIANSVESIVLYDIINQKEIVTIKEPSFAGKMMEKVRYIWVKFSVDNRFVFYTNNNKLMRYDIFNAEVVKLKSPGGDYLALQNSPDGKYLFAGTEEGFVQKIDVSSFQVITTLPKFSNAIASIAFSNDAKSIAIGCVDSKISILSADNLSTINTFTNEGGGALSIEFSSDNNSVFCNNFKTVFKLKATNGELLNKQDRIQNTYIRDVMFTNGGSKLSILKGQNYLNFDLSNLTMNKSIRNEKFIEGNILASPDRSYYVAKIPGSKRKHILYPQSPLFPTDDNWMFIDFYEVGFNQSEDTREIFRKNNGALGCWYYKPLCFSSDNSTLIAGKNAYLYIYNIGYNSITIIDSVNLGSSKSAYQAKFNSNTKDLAVLTLSGEAFLYDLKNHNPKNINGSIYGSLQHKKSFTTECTKATAICLSNDNAKLAICDLTKGLTLYSTTDGSVIANVKINGDLPSKLYFTPDGKQLVLIIASGKIVFFDANTLKKNFELLLMDEDDWMISTPENYYFAAKNTNSKIKFRDGQNIYPVEQFELKYNRPDIVLAKTGFGNQKSIDVYKIQYQKRLKAIGFNEVDLALPKNLPKCEISNEIPVKVNQTELKINFNLNDSLYTFKKLYVIVNGMSIYGTSGMDLSVVKEKALKKEIAVSLLEGTNTISYYAVNTQGISTLRREIKVKCETDKKIKPKLYIISIGVSEYKNKAFNLNYASKDANDIIQSYMKQTIYDSVIVKKMTDKEVTRKSFLQLKDFAKQIKSNDLVFVFIAGHGILDKNYNYYFGAYDIDFNNPSLAGISFKDIEDLLASIASYRKFLIMDTCHSGEIDKDDVSQSNDENKPVANVTFRSSGNVAVKNKTGLTQNELNLLTGEMFSDLRLGTGATIIASANGTELAMESDKWKNGLFTYCFLNGLQTKAADLDHDGYIMLSELRKFLNEDVEIKSGGKQKPATRAFNKDGDFRVW